MTMVDMDALQEKVLQQLESNESKGWELCKGERGLVSRSWLMSRDGHHSPGPERFHPETVPFLRAESVDQHTDWAMTDGQS